MIETETGSPCRIARDGRKNHRSGGKGVRDVFWMLQASRWHRFRAPERRFPGMPWSFTEQNMKAAVRSRAKAGSRHHLQEAMQIQSEFLKSQLPMPESI